VIASERGRVFIRVRVLTIRHIFKPRLTAHSLTDGDGDGTLTSTSTSTITITRDRSKM
jgi:hypothetical protein